MAMLAGFDGFSGEFISILQSLPQELVQTYMYAFNDSSVARYIKFGGEAYVDDILN
jgi:hypothetical protein